MNKLGIIIILAIASLIVYGQRSKMELTFTAFDSAAYIQHDSIKVMNTSKGCDTVLVFPDTILVLDYTVGINEINSEGSRFRILQIYPNPVADQTTISLYVPEQENVNIIVTDVLWRMIIQYEQVLNEGEHTFRFCPGGGNLFFFTAICKDQSSSAKILHHASGAGTNSLEYLGGIPLSRRFKAFENVQGFKFNLGDTLLYICYKNNLESGLFDTPENDSNYTFQFAYDIPCLEIPWVSYAGGIYHTVQIFNQCWFDRNLNVGTMIPALQEMTDNDTIEKYCYDDNFEHCFAYGGLYQWDEMMNYISQEGSQGLCPDGWHIPTDGEIKLLSGTADSQYGIGDTIWDLGFTYRGYDAGHHLKSDNGWYGGYTGSNMYGFSTLPCGRRIWDGQYNNLGTVSWIWTSTTYNTHWGWYKEIHYKVDNLGRYYTDKKDGLGFRCIKD